MPSSRRLALKIDCDTYEGTKAGIPNLLKLFDEHRIKASFYFTLGPDTTGRAIFRVFTRKGFLKKMLQSKAVSLYGPKTLLYGTLLPPPDIAKKLAETIRSVEKAGHEVGVHGWNHVRWHDKLDQMTDAEIEQDYGAAHAAFAKIFGRAARTSAAPGWHATPAYLRIQKKFNLFYSSNTRGGSPCFLEEGGERFDTLEIPSTLPTWDEIIGTPEFPDDARIIEYYCSAIRGTEVHSIHTEVEGTARFDLFRRQIEAWKVDGVEFITLEALAGETLARRSQIPVRSLVRTEIPNRTGLVSATR